MAPSTLRRARSRGIAGILALALGLGALAACSSSGGSDSGTGGSSSTTIKLGLVSDEQAATASTNKGYQAAARARIEEQNDAGGINGRKIELTGLDTGSNLTQILTSAKRLESDGVLGVLQGSSFGAGDSSFLNGAGVPIIGADMGGSEWSDSKNTLMFSVSGKQAPGTPAFDVHGQYFKSQGATKMAFLGYANVPSTALANKLSIESAKAAGLQVCYDNESLALANTDFTGVALAIKEKKCDGLTAALSLAAYINLLKALKDADVSLKVVYVLGGYGNTTISDPTTVRAAEGATFLSFFAPVELETAATKAFQAGLKKYANYTANPPNQAYYLGWLAADAAIQGLKAAGDNPTRESFVQGLKSVKSYDGDGLLPRAVDLGGVGVGDVNFIGGQCSYAVKMESGKFVPINNGQPLCGKILPGTEQKQK